MSIKLTDASQEESKKFSEGLTKLLNELSLALSLTINKIPVTIKLENGQVKNVFTDEPSLIIQHKMEVELVEKEIVSPYNKDENPPKTA